MTSPTVVPHFASASGMFKSDVQSDFNVASNKHSFRPPRTCTENSFKHSVGVIEKDFVCHVSVLFLNRL